METGKVMDGKLDQSRRAERRATGSIFIQDEWRLNSRLTANAGLRADHVSSLSGGTRLGPRASVSWVSPSGLSAHAGYARYFVAPPVGDGVVVPCRVYSNSCFGTLSGWAGLSGAFRSMACSEVGSTRPATSGSSFGLA